MTRYSNYLAEVIEAEVLRLNLHGFQSGGQNGSKHQTIFNQILHESKDTQKDTPRHKTLSRHFQSPLHFLPS